jgi:hypothetical protein
LRFIVLALLPACATTAGETPAPDVDAAVPDIDAALVVDAGAPDATPAPVPCTANGSVVTLERGAVRVEYDLTTGTAHFLAGGARKITGF